MIPIEDHLTLYLESISEVVQWGGKLSEQACARLDLLSPRVMRPGAECCRWFRVSEFVDNCRDGSWAGWRRKERERKRSEGGGRVEEMGERK